MNVTGLIIKHEGFRSHAYQCTAGKWTLGFGRNVDKLGGKGISHDEGLMLLSNDIQEITQEVSKKLIWFQGLNEARKAAIVDMIYNLGFGGFGKFRQFQLAMARGDFQKASQEMLQSLWAKQVGSRADELSQIISTGEWPEEGKVLE